MVKLRVIQVLLFMSLLTAHHGKVDKARDCKFITCRDCATVGCVWALYINKAQNCVADTKGIPGVEAEVDDPSECAHPKCVMPAPKHWDAKEIALTLGGICGGLLAGLCGGAGLQSWRLGRNRGYERLGPRSCTEAFLAFFGAFFHQLERVDQEAFLRGDDDEDDRRRREAVRRIEARQAAENRRQAEAREEVPQDPPAQDPVPHDQEPQVPQDIPVQNPPAINLPQIPADMLDIDDDGDDDNGAGGNDGNNGGQGVGGRQEEQPGPAPLPQVSPRRPHSTRQASVEAAEKIAALRIQRKI